MPDEGGFKNSRTEIDPQKEKNVFVMAIRAKMRDEGVSFQKCIEIARADIERSKEIDKSSYEAHLKLLDDAIDYLRSLGVK